MVETLEQAVVMLHRSSDFKPTDPRSNLRYLEEIASDLLVGFTRRRGTLELGITAVDMVWLERGEKGPVIDPTYPVKHPEFRRMAADWVSGLIFNLELGDYIKCTVADSPSLWVVGEQDERYRGKPYW